MRSRLLLSLVAAAASIASSAQAGNLISATWTQTLQTVNISVTGTDTNSDGVLDIGGSACGGGVNVTQQTITCPASLTGSSGVATSTAYSAFINFPLFTLSQFTTGGAFNVNTMATISGATGVFGTNGSAVGTLGGVPGMVTIRVAVHAAKGANASMQTIAPTTLLRVPLAIGKAGVTTGYFTLLGSSHYITIDYYGWTAHTLTFTGLTTKGVGLPSVIAMGSFNLTGGGGGTVTLVAPSKISIDSLLVPRRTVGFASLKLTFVPEPSALLLLGAGVVGLALVGSRRR